MMKSHSMQTQRRSPLLETQRMTMKGGKKLSVRDLAQALPLTSLIDAFSIIVIYLLIGTQSGGIETSIKGMNLPIAQNSQGLEKSVAILRIQNNQFFLNDQPVTLKNLTEKLVELKNSTTEKIVELMVQADQNMEYSQLDPLIKAGSLAGIEKLKFAVLPKQ